MVPGANQMQRDLRKVVKNPRALRAFARLGITTVGDFLATPKEKLLEIPGFGERTLWHVSERIRAAAGHRQAVHALLPAALLEFSASGLDLTPGLRQHLADLGIETVRNILDVPTQALATEHTIGEAGLAEIRTALDKLVRLGTEQTLERPEPEQGQDFRRFRTQLLSVLDHQQQLLLCQRIGLERPQRSREAVATDLGLSQEQTRSLEQATRLALRQRAPELLARIRQEADEASESMIRTEDLATGTVLHELARSTGDDLLPLRLVQFCFPKVYHLHGELLTRIPPRLWRRLRAVLTHYSHPKRLPVPLKDVELHVKAIIDPVPRRLMLHLLTKHHRLAIRVDPDKGETLERVRDSVADRLHAILQDAEDPVPAEDLLFQFRDRHGQARLDNILESLGQDPRFLQVSKHEWALRSRFQTELETTACEAEHIAHHVITQGQRRDVFELGGRDGVSERTVYLIIDCLRRNPSLRHLAGGEFCPATVRTSATMRKILRDFQRAMGEVVTSRFLRNQKPHRRRLIGRLLHENRMFVEPSPDRVDLLSNYPFNAERLRRLLATVGSYLDQQGGYASTLDLVEHLDGTELGGSWLTEHLLSDVLRRHSSFELLPGGLVAQRSLGLAGWIQRRAREALRATGTPLTIYEVLAEHPELATFEECLAELLDQDPMVETHDGVRYRVV